MEKIRKSLLIVIFLMLLYALLRILFYQMHFSKTGIAGKQLLTVFYWGWRMDITGIFYANALFFLYYFLVHDFIPRRLRQALSVAFLAVVNLPLLAVNIIDLAYYQFNLRRSTIDLFSVLRGSFSAVGAFWKNWWWLFVLFILLSVVSVMVFSYLMKDKELRKCSFKQNLAAAVCFLLPAVLLARGWSDRPIIPSTPILYIPANYQALATNSTVTLLYSIVKRQTTLLEKNYYTRPDSLFTARRQYNAGATFIKKNVVVFILESFSKEYTEKNDPLHAQMPFLDSVMAESMVCENAYANGLESNKGLMAVLGGIPPFFDEPFYYSRYSNNKIRGVGALLKEQGYNTSFFMGAGYDHFGFARLAAMLGIERYYSMKDYGNKKHYDGNWGIFDHYFLPYAARQLSGTAAPFFSSLFTISTHFPYTLPDTLKKQFTIPGQGAAQNSMSYLDYALRLFFETASKQPWYNNTLFVFTADHNLYWHASEKASLYKTFRIPVFFYMPGQRQHMSIRKPVQQMDIIPSVLDLLHYPQPFMSFGKSAFDTLSPGSAIGHFNDIYQMIDSSYIFGYNEKTEQPAYLYNFRTDTALINNLLAPGQLPSPQAASMEEQVKAQLQYFNYSMIKNKLYIQ